MASRIPTEFTGASMIQGTMGPGVCVYGMSCWMEDDGAETER